MGDGERTGQRVEAGTGAPRTRSGAPVPRRRRRAGLAGAARHRAIRPSSRGAGEPREPATRLPTPSREVIIGFAKKLDFDGFRQVVRRWGAALADADGAHRGHEAAHEGRRASAHPVRRHVQLHGAVRGDPGHADGQGPRGVLRGRVPGRLGQGQGRDSAMLRRPRCWTHGESAAGSTRCSPRSWPQSKTTRARCRARW